MRPPDSVNVDDRDTGDLLANARAILGVRVDEEIPSWSPEPVVREAAEVNRLDAQPMPEVH
ncbi:MAG: hypothetical protein ACRCU1_13995 [Alsobacter sp.]